MAKANLGAALVPLEVLEHSVTALQLALEAAAKGNPNSVSDAGVAGACAEAAAHGASLNVRINLPGLTPDEQVEIEGRHDAALAQVQDLASAITDAVNEALEA